MCVKFPQGVVIGFGVCDALVLHQHRSAAFHTWVSGALSGGPTGGSLFIGGGDNGASPPATPMVRICSGVSAVLYTATSSTVPTPGVSNAGSLPILRFPCASSVPKPLRPAVGSPSI